MIEAGSSRVRPRLRGRPVPSGAWASWGPSCGTPGHGVERAGNAGFEQRAARVGNVDDSDQAGVADDWQVPAPTWIAEPGAYSTAQSFLSRR
jgi:hypothetical protein